jgi:hypothetical protein
MGARRRGVASAALRFADASGRRSLIFTRRRRAQRRAASPIRIPRSQASTYFIETRASLRERGFSLVCEGTNRLV